MKRPLAVIGFSYMAALAVAFIIGKEYLILLFAISAISGSISLLYKPMRKNGIVPAILFSSAVAVILLSGYDMAYTAPCDDLYGKTITVKGKLCDLPYKQDDRYYYKISVESTEPYHYVKNTNILISAKYRQDYGLYDTITTKVQIYKKDNSSMRFHQLAKGIQLRGYLPKGEIFSCEENTGNKPLYYYALLLRQHLTKISDEKLSYEDSALVRAVLIGDKTSLTASQRDIFTRAGITDLMCVSGLHLSVITSAAFSVMYFITRKRKLLSSFLCIFFVFTYMAVTGFTVSVTRAGIMQILYLMSITVFYKSDPINSLGLSVLLICFMNPYSALDISFLLSFSATLGIIVCGTRLSEGISNKLFPFVFSKYTFKNIQKKLIKQFFNAVISMFTLGLSVSIFTAPVLIIYFHRISIYAVLFHIFITYAVSLLLIISPVFFILCAVGAPGAILFPISGIISFLTNYIRGCAGLVVYLPSPVIYTAREFVMICLILTVAAVIVYFLMIKNRVRAAALSVITAIAVFASGAAADSILNSESVKVSVLDAGQGLTVLISDGTDAAVLFCGGSYDKSLFVSSYIEQLTSGRISYLLLMDKKRSCTGYADNLIENHDIANIHLYEPDKFKESIQEQAEQTENHLYSSSGEQVIAHWNGIDIHTIKIRRSCAVYFEVFGNSFLVLADKTDCASVPENIRNADFLIFSGALKNSSMISAKNIIVSDDPENIADDLRNIDMNGNCLYYTAGEGNIAVRVFSGTKKDIRRESDWQS